MDDHQRDRPAGACATRRAGFDRVARHQRGVVVGAKADVGPDALDAVLVAQRRQGVPVGDEDRVLGGSAAKICSVRRSPSRLADWSWLVQFDAAGAARAGRALRTGRPTPRVPTAPTTQAHRPVDRDREPDSQDEPRQQQVVRQVAQVVGVEVDVDDARARSGATRTIGRGGRAGRSRTRRARRRRRSTSKRGGR